MKGICIKVEIADDFVEIIFAFVVNTIGGLNLTTFCVSPIESLRHAIYQTIFTTVRKMCFSNLL